MLKFYFSAIKFIAEKYFLKEVKKMNLNYEIDRMLLKELDKDLKKEIEKYVSDICNEKEEKNIEMPVYEKPSFSIRAVKFMIPFMESANFHNTWTYNFLCHYGWISSIPQNRKKYRSYHGPSKYEMIISDKLANKFNEWRKQNDK